MFRKICSSIIMIALLICMQPVMAAAAVPTEAPADLTLMNDDGFIFVAWRVPENVQKWYIENNDGSVELQCDYRVDEEAWKYTSSWDQIGVSDDLPDPWWIYDGSGYFSDVTGGMEKTWNPEDSGHGPLDTLNHLYQMRVRFVYKFHDEESDSYSYQYSPWSQVASIGKGVGKYQIKSLEAPQNLKAELKTNDQGVPYFQLDWTNPASVVTADVKSDSGVSVIVESKVGNGDWLDTGNGSMSLSNSDDIEPEDEGDMTEIDIKAKTYQFRICYTNRWENGGLSVKSPYSNIVTIGTPAFYHNASSWATAELDKAAELGLITDRIKDNMAGKITREEFAEIAVKLYEIYTGKIATVGNVSFVDTQNPEILKAANLGLVQGVGNDKYAPNNLITREQMATIMLRVLKVINPAEDYSTEGVTNFGDDNNIKSWAREGVYYCAKVGIVTGVGNNMYNPNGNATREQAVIVCTRAYEKKN